MSTLSAKKEKFFNDVIHEINMLKKHATQEELSRLNVCTFDFSSIEKCIYGQMTGNCESARSKELMDLSCIKVMHLNDGTDEISLIDIDDNKFNINGKYNGQTWVGYLGCLYRSYTYLSALEGYICTNNANVAGIISYLKGEIKDLKL